MKRGWRIIALGAVFLVLSLAISSVFAALKELRGDHFIVLYEADETYARQVLGQAERLYSTIMRNLGHDQIAQPWRGDRRCKITIFKDQKGFQEKTAGIDWAEGMADYQKREIFAFQGTEHLLSNVLPHEIAHLMFREIMGTRRRIPLWLEEGVALSQEPDRPQQFYPMASQALEKGTFMPFEKMTSFTDARGMKKEEAGIFYAQSLATVNYLMESFHRDKFLRFCRLLKGGKPLADALKQVYGTDRISSIADLQKHVQDYLARQ